MLKNIKSTRRPKFPQKSPLKPKILTCSWVPCVRDHYACIQGYLSPITISCLQFIIMFPPVLRFLTRAYTHFSYPSPAPRILHIHLPTSFSKPPCPWSNTCFIPSSISETREICKPSLVMYPTLLAALTLQKHFDSTRSIISQVVRVWFWVSEGM